MHATLVLSKREQEIIALLAEGKSYRAVAADLDIAHDTVRAHMRKVYLKLGVHNRTELVVRAIRSGIMTVDNTPARMAHSPSSEHP